MIEGSTKDLREDVGRYIKLQGALEAIEASFEWVEQIFDCRPPRTRLGITLWVKFSELLTTAPVDDLYLHSERLEQDGASAIARKAIADGLSLRSRRDEIDSTIDVALAMQLANSVDLDEVADAIESSGFLSRLFGRAYRKARKHHRQIVRTKQKVKRNKAAEECRRIAAYLRCHNEFSTRSEYASLLGQNFASVDSDWAGFAVLVDWYDNIFTCLPEHISDAGALRHVLLKGRTELIKSLRNDEQGGPAHQTVRWSTDLLLQSHDVAPAKRDSANVSISELREALASRIATLEDLLVRVGATSIGEEKPLRSLPVLVASGTRYLDAVSGLGRMKSRRRAWAANTKVF